jgi:hypothetical protein
MTWTDSERRRHLAWILSDPTTEKEAPPMTVYHYKDSSQAVLKGDRVQLPDGRRGELRDLYLSPSNYSTHPDMIPTGEVAMTSELGTAEFDTAPLADLTYIPPEVETMERTLDARWSAQNVLAAVTEVPPVADPVDWIRDRALRMAIDARTPQAVAEDLVGQAVIFEAYLRDGTVPEVPEPYTGPRLNLSWSSSGIGKIVGVDVYDSELRQPPAWPKWVTGQPILPGDDFRAASSPIRRTVALLQHDGTEWTVLDTTGQDVYSPGALFYLPPSTEDEGQMGV